MSLDTERKDVPYLLGRLFSLLEKNQRDALGNNINSTIRDRYIASASATPRRVFRYCRCRERYPGFSCHADAGRAGRFLSRLLPAEHCQLP